MLAMMPLIADYTFKMFLTFYILQAELPKHHDPYSPSQWAWVR